jgi:hypothetical protein
MASPTVDPASLGFIVFSQGTEQIVRLGKASVPARVTTKILLEDPAAIVVRVDHVSVLHVYEMAPDNFDLPPGKDPGPLVLVPTELVVAQSDGTTPVNVNVDDEVRIALVAEQMSPSVDRLAGSLLISGDTWDPILVPLTFKRGAEVTSVAQPDSLTIQQGGIGLATIVARWVSGAYSDVTYDLVPDAEAFGVTMEPDPASVRILPGETKTLTLSFRVERDAPLGRRLITIWESGGGGRRLKLGVDIKPAPPAPPPPHPDIAQATAAIDAFYRGHRAHRGPFGFPLTGVELTAGVPSRRYAGGYIRYIQNTPRGTDLTWVRIRFLGFECIYESDFKLSASDEPYFIIGVAGTNNSNTVRFGPYEDIDKGERRYEATDIATVTHKIVPPVVLGVFGIEHDEGTPEEAEAQVRSAIEGLEDNFQQAGGSFSAADVGSHVMPEWARDILIGWVPEAWAALFGLGDDEIGREPIVLFDQKGDLLTWTAPPPIGRHGSNEYNTVAEIGGQSQGTHKLYFKVDLFRSTDVIQ